MQLIRSLEVREGGMEGGRGEDKGGGQETEGARARARRSRTKGGGGGRRS